MATPKKPLTPINRLGRYEAVSKDAQWRYLWVEDGNTPWAVVCAQTGQEVYYSSLRAARQATASRSALRQLAFDCESVLRDDQATAEKKEAAQRRLDHYRRLGVDTSQRAA